MNNPSAADVLDAAADVIETEGWAQGTTRSVTTGGWCAHGAISIGRHRLGSAYEVAVEARLALTTHLLPHSIVWFNDDPTTTQFDVIDAMRHTAKEIRNGEISPSAWLRSDAHTRWAK